MQFLNLLTMISLLFALLAVAPGTEAKNHNKASGETGNWTPTKPVSPEVFDDLELYSHFAAAAYCPANLKYQPGERRQLSCDMTTAPCVLAEKEDTMIMYSWKFKGPFRLSGNVVADYDREQIIVSFAGNVEQGSQYSVENDMEWKVRPGFGLGVNKYIGNNLVEWDSADCNGCRASKKTKDMWKTIQNQIAYVVADLGVPKFPHVVMVGHGQGGAIATAAAMWARQQGINTTLYTYGAPRVGNEAFANYLSNQGQNYRVTHKGAEGSRGPPMKHGFRHMMPEYYIKTAKRGEYPTIEDITEVPGMENHRGNGGDGSGFSGCVKRNRNRWFFGQINRCQPHAPKDKNGAWTPYLAGEKSMDLHIDAPLMGDAPSIDVEE